LQDETGNGNSRRTDFPVFDDLGEPSFVAAVGELAGDTREKQEGHDEHRAGERHRLRTSVAAKLERDMDDQRI
jgi:hypothetical protein